MAIHGIITGDIVASQKMPPKVRQKLFADIDIFLKDLKKKWVNNPSGIENELAIISERTDPAPGTHIINYHSDIDDICITHTAHSRKGFASGAVLAAEFLAKKKTGVYSMKDVLGME